MRHFAIILCLLEERIPSYNYKILRPRIMGTRIKLRSIQCVGHK